MTGTQGSMASGSRRLTKEEQEKLEREAREARGGLSNIKNLLAEAYEDTNARSPVLFLVTQAINVQEIVHECL